MKYYLIIVTTIYDGLEFTQHIAFERDKEIKQKEAERLAEEYLLHEDTGEELDRVELIEIIKKEYEVFKKYHI